MLFVVWKVMTMARKLCLGLPGEPCSTVIEVDRSWKGARGARCQRCARIWDRRAGTARERGYDREYDENRAILLSKPQNCWKCGLPGADSADHVIPRSRGGSNALSNLRPAHEACNYSAGGAVSRGGRGQS